MIGAAAAYMSGLFFASFFNNVHCIIILTFIAVSAFIIEKNSKWKIYDFLLIAVLFSAGFAANIMYTSIKYGPAIALDGQSGSFEGEVTEITRYDGDMAKYVLKGRANGNIKVKLTYFGEDTDAEYGDTIKFESCTFSILTRDYLFDSERYYKSDGVFLSAENAEDISVIHKNSRRLKNMMADFREDMTFRFTAETEHDVGAFLSGMIFGEKRGLDYSAKKSLYRSGISHVLAVSGLHVSIIAALLMSVLNALKIDRRVSFVVMDIVLAGFILMANTPVSAIRAAVMMNFFYAAGLFRRQNDSFNSLAGAVLLISLANPYCIFDEGFLLSISGTFGIAVFAPIMTKNISNETLPDILKRDLITGLCTSIAVFPMCMMFFDETSVIAPLTNILLVPVCTAAMTTGLIFMLTGGLLPVLKIAEVLIKMVILISRKLADISIFHIAHGSDKAAESLIFLGTACVLAYMVTHSRRITSVLIAFSFMAYSTMSASYQRQRYNDFIAAVLGNGANAAVVIRYKGSTNIIDLTGNRRNAAYISRYLAINGIETADSLVLTKSPQTQYVSYAEEFYFVDIKECLAMSDTAVASAEIDRYFDESGFVINGKDYIIDFSDSILTVCFGNDKIMFVPSGDEQYSSGIAVCYGDAPKKEKFDDILYLCDQNNFEIVLSGDSMYRRKL